MNTIHKNMIINTQLSDCLDKSGNKTKELILSYFNKSGEISYLKYVIPTDQLYNWYYAKPGDVPDPVYTSWDGKRVAKRASDGYLNDQRVHQILEDLIKHNPNINVIHELSIPFIHFCDIEVDVDDSGFPNPEDANNKVNTISWVYKNSVIVFGRVELSGEQINRIQSRIKEHCKTFKTEYLFTYLYYETESAMLMDFMYNYVKHANCISGWNFMGYDWRYLYNRCSKLGIDITSISPNGSWTKYSLVPMFKGSKRTKIDVPMHKLLFDYMEVYFKWDMSITPKEGFTLDIVAEAALGVKKVKHSLGFKDMWEQEPEDYVFYNAIDSILVREIDNKLKTANTFFSLANLIHCDALLAFSPVQSLHVVQGEYMYRENKVFPYAKNGEIDDEGYEGAFVFEPITGVYKDVIALDFASLYPTTMRQFNISPDTFVKKDKQHKRKDNEIKCCNGSVYVKDFEGMLPKILTSFYNQRVQFKEEMKKATTELYALKDILEKRENELKK